MSDTLLAETAGCRLAASLPVAGRDQATCSKEGMAWVPGGAFLMGSNHHYPEESPAHRVRVDPFWMDVTTVTNDEFTCFVAETGYVTLAERPPNPEEYPDALVELLVPASAVFTPPQGKVQRDNAYVWWSYVPGANWSHPSGPSSSLEGLGQHPVVHVAYEDAQAYAKWANKELPTEAEFEFAARGGFEGREFVWGDELHPDGRMMANTWQGEFPWENTLSDGYEWTSSVRAFPPNGFGLYDMAGNVWQWTSDWYQDHARIEASCCTMDNPRGGAENGSRRANGAVDRHDHLSRWLPMHKQSEAEMNLTVAKLQMPRLIVNHLNHASPVSS
jgi:formylglycine-generating enzyme